MGRTLGLGRPSGHASGGETQEEAAARKRRAAELQTARRADETQEEAADRRRRDALRQADYRANETQEAAAARKQRAAVREAGRRAKETLEEAAARKQRAAVREAGRRAKETLEEAAARKQRAAVREAGRRAKETPEVAAARKQRDALRQADHRANEAPEARGRGKTAEEKAGRAAGRVALRTRQLRHLAGGDDSDSDGAGVTGAGAAGRDFPPRSSWDLVDAMERHLYWKWRRPDNPERPPCGEFLESEATRDWPQRQQDLPEGEPLKEIPFSVHVDTAVKLAHVANHHMPDSVCACCSEMKAPVEYTRVPWRSSCFQLLRADIPRTTAVIRPACTVYERSELREMVPPPPDPVLPVGFTRRGLEQWVRAGHTLPFDQKFAPSKGGGGAAAAGAAGPSGGGAAAAGATGTSGGVVMAAAAAAPSGGVEAAAGAAGPNGGVEAAAGAADPSGGVVAMAAHAGPSAVAAGGGDVEMEEQLPDLDDSDSCCDEGGVGWLTSVGVRRQIAGDGISERKSKATHTVQCGVGSNCVRHVLSLLYT